MSFNAKARSAFKKLGAVALITATTLTLAVFFTACDQTGGGGGTQKPKHAINFSVDSTTPNGILTAKVDGAEPQAQPAISPINVEEGKTIIFTATPNAGYVVKEWKMDGNAIAEAGTKAEYTHTVAKPCAITVSFELGKAILTLEAGKNTIKVRAKTVDGSAIEVEGCTVATLASDVDATLTATGSVVTLKGYITKLDCSRGEENNARLTALDVQGCTALEMLLCAVNKLESEVFTKLFNDLPTRGVGENATAKLYAEQTGMGEENCKDFSTPESLKKAFEEAKGRNWRMQKLDEYGRWKDI